MEIVKLTTVLGLFFAVNHTDSKDSFNLEESVYDDKFFRWTKDSFKHKEDLTIIYNKRRILIFNTVKVRDRLLANQSKIQKDKEGLNFGCQYSIVTDLVIPIYAEEISDDDIVEFYDEKKRLQKESEERKKSNMGVPNKK